MVEMVPEEEGQAALLAFDLDTAQRTHAIVLDHGDHFLNDVAVARDGTVYVTDSGTGDVHRYRPSGEFEPFVNLRAHGSPNGIDLSGPPGVAFCSWRWGAASSASRSPPEP